MCASG